MSTRSRIAAAAVAAVGATVLVAAPASAADGRCQAAGIATLK